jgi:hypothetical protein
MGSAPRATLTCLPTRSSCSQASTPSGWITIIVGIIELTAGFSLFGGGGYGRIIGIFAASIGALDSLLSIGGTHPWWSLAIFALCVYIVHGLIVFGEEEGGASLAERIVGADEMPGPNTFTCNFEATLPWSRVAQERFVS